MRAMWQGGRPWTWQCWVKVAKIGLVKSGEQSFWLVIRRSGIFDHRKFRHKACPACYLLARWNTTTAYSRRKSGKWRRLSDYFPLAPVLSRSQRSDQGSTVETRLVSSIGASNYRLVVLGRAVTRRRSKRPSPWHVVFFELYMSGVRYQHCSGLILHIFLFMLPLSSSHLCDRISYLKHLLYLEPASQDDKFRSGGSSTRQRSWPGNRQRNPRRCPRVSRKMVARKRIATFTFMATTSGKKFRFKGRRYHWQLCRRDFCRISCHGDSACSSMEWEE